MTTSEEFTPLQGGGSNTVQRSGNVVWRKAGYWSHRVHEFLKFIAQQGFGNAPKVVGFDGEGNELLTYMPGEVGNYPLSEHVRSEGALISAAKLLRHLHDVSVPFIAGRTNGWMLPAREPLEVICHSDFAPYNCVFANGHAIGVIDFDGAHPGPRRWDLAYTLYRFAPMSSPTNTDGFGNLEEQLHRARLFCDAYGLQTEDRIALPALVIQRLKTLIDFMHSQASEGNLNAQRNIEVGHADLYREDINYISAHANEFERILTCGHKTDSLES
jgi:Phosphotransferase enzyme family